MPRSMHCKTFLHVLNDCKIHTTFSDLFIHSSILGAFARDLQYQCNLCGRKVKENMIAYNLFFWLTVLYHYELGRWTTALSLYSVRKKEKNIVFEIKINRWKIK